MENHEFNTFKFFRRYYNIPRNIKLQWCVVEEIVDGQMPEYELGVLLYDAGRKYVSVPQRRMFSQVSCGLVKRTAWPAVRSSEGNNYRYRVPGTNLCVIRSKAFIADIYASSWYTDDTPRMVLM